MRSFRTPVLSAVAATVLVASSAGVALVGGSPAVAAPSPDLSITNVTAHLQQLQPTASSLAFTQSSDAF